MLEIGSLLDNKYKILSEVGHGGMSVVYLAINERANKTWAVKEIRKNGVVDFESVKQGLVVETDMLKRLNHEYLPSIVDVIDTSDSFIIVMDYIEGSSLQHLLNTAGAQQESKVIRWAKQLCDVLGYLHRQNPSIIYRDMKPANVMLKPNGDITLIDFGTAREFKDRAMVEDTTCLGTRGYAAPEQFGGRGQTDARTDIYCLGATMYHLLTGHSPAEPPYEIKPLSYWIPQYAGSGLEKLILKCTQQDPNERYQNCAELMYELEHYREEDEAMRRKRKSKLSLFIVAAVVGIVGIIGTIAFNALRTSAVYQSYDYKIELAEGASDMKEAKDNYLAALELRAGDRKVYESIMSKGRTEIGKNGNVLSSETASAINSILTSTSSGAGAYIETLKNQDPEEYTKIMYEMGLWYFFMKGNTDSDKSYAGENYFSKIQDDATKQYLDTNQQQLSAMLNKMGNYILKLGGGQAKFGMDSEDSVTFKQFFDDITQMAGRDLKTETGRDSYAIKIYEQIASWILDKEENFESDGVTINEMKATLNAVKAGLEALGISQDNNNYAEYAAARATVEQAIDLIDRAAD